MLAFVGYHFFAEVLEQPNENTLSTNILLFQPLILFDRDLKDHFDLGFRICPASFTIQVVPEALKANVSQEKFSPMPCLRTFSNVLF